MKMEPELAALALHQGRFNIALLATLFARGDLEHGEFAKLANSAAKSAEDLGLPDLAKVWYDALLAIAEDQSRVMPAAPSE